MANEKREIEKILKKKEPFDLLEETSFKEEVKFEEEKEDEKVGIEDTDKEIKEIEAIYIKEEQLKETEKKKVTKKPEEENVSEEQMHFVLAKENHFCKGVSNKLFYYLKKISEETSLSQGLTKEIGPSKGQERNYYSALSQKFVDLCTLQCSTPENSKNISSDENFLDMKTWFSHQQSIRTLQCKIFENDLLTNLPSEIDRCRSSQHIESVKSSNSIGNLETEIIFNFSESLSGKMCKQSLKNKNSVNKTLGFLSSNLFLCNVCEKSFKRKDTLKQHMLSHTDEKPHTCGLCQKSFKWKCSLRKHILSHSDEKPFACDKCDESFKSKTNLKYHLLSHFENKPYVCKICGKSFKQKCHLKDHFKTHSDVKPFECKICAKCFIQQSHLRMHMVSHSDDKPFACKLCSKSFNRKSNMKQHMVSHSAVKPFICEICSKSFGHKYVLKRHMFLHLDEKPISCEMCDESFKQETNLNDHILTHSGAKPFV